MKMTLRAPLVLTLESPVRRAVVFAALSLVRSVLITVFVFMVFSWDVYRYHAVGVAMLWLAKVLNLPILLFSWTIGRLASAIRSPFGFGGLDLRGFDGVLNFRAVFLNHLRAGVLCYMLLFHVPTILRFFRRQSQTGEHERAV